MLRQTSDDETGVRVGRQRTFLSQSWDLDKLFPPPFSLYRIYSSPHPLIFQAERRDQGRVKPSFGRRAGDCWVRWPP